MTKEFDNQPNVEPRRFPKWLHRPMPKGGNLFKTGGIIENYNLNTVCEEAKCPNRWECYSQKTATFLALGSACTRACGFCEIDFSKNPPPPEEDEPERIALSVKELGLKHAVITMVARDDLEDKGAAQIGRIIQAIRLENPEATVEVLTSDFSGDLDALDLVLDAKPEIFNHNVETVRRLSSKVRHKATYEQTLKMLRHAASSKQSLFVKSGLMVGLGEETDEVKQSLVDLHEAGVEIITIGQYLQASRKKLRVKDFVPPETFEEYETFGRQIGIKEVYSGPFVRSSYNAAKILEKLSC
ncbi:MAG: Lipoyl synthase [Chlamydiia bacterium]|nr:Lipoyl synthase [Chlamydiia bacterium]MCH9616269.1 Lipoyl synthase [Chlamydiia bacterium]MCH9629745.1 Lipoyl synthase [Chlamydiia bacterium]